MAVKINKTIIKRIASVVLGVMVVFYGFRVTEYFFNGIDTIRDVIDLLIFIIPFVSLLVFLLLWNITKSGLVYLILTIPFIYITVDFIKPGTGIGF